MKGQVKLTNGEILNVKRISPFSLHEGMREKLRFLEDQTRGTSLLRFHRKLEREEGRVARLNRMVDRCEAFITHPDTNLDKREEYLKKIETYENEIEKAQETVDNLSEELIDLDSKIKKFSREVAIWYAGQQGKEADQFDEVSNDEVNIGIVRAMLGLEPLEEDVSEPPLDGTEKNSPGPGA